MLNSRNVWSQDLPLWFSSTQAQRCNKITYVIHTAHRMFHRYRRELESVWEEVSFWSFLTRIAPPAGCGLQTIQINYSFNILSIFLKLCIASINSFFVGVVILLSVLSLNTLLSLHVSDLIKSIFPLSDSLSNTSFRYAFLFFSSSFVNSIVLLWALR